MLKRINASLKKAQIVLVIGGHRDYDTSYYYTVVVSMFKSLRRLPIYNLIFSSKDLDLPPNFIKELAKLTRSVSTIEEFDCNTEYCTFPEICKATQVKQLLYLFNTLKNMKKVTL